MIISLAFIVQSFLVNPYHSSFEVVLINCAVNTNMVTSLELCDTFQLPYSITTNKMQRYTMVFITLNALHASGGSSAHHQELNTVYTASGICRAFSASYRCRE
jgi:hypothetical protein